jgi:hypothetical protein
MTGIFAEMRVTECDADFWINDIPVWRMLHREAVFQGIPVHEFLVDGTNTLRVTLVGAQPTAAQAAMTVSQYPAGARLGQGAGRLLGAVDLRTPGANNQPVIVAESSFSASLPLRWSWQDLPVVDWAAPNARAAVEQFLQEFARRLQASDRDWLVHVFEPRMADYCRAYGLDLQAELAEMDMRIARRRADSAFVVRPVTVADLALRPCAAGQLVECLLLTGEPAIRWTDSRLGPNGAWNVKLGAGKTGLRCYR